MAKRISTGRQKEILNRIKDRERRGGGAKKPAPITKAQFHQILEKASQPIKKSDSE